MLSTPKSFRIGNCIGVLEYGNLPPFMNALIVIPARYGSTRFPGKPLVLIKRKPLIQWVWEAACKSRRATRVVVATDDQRIRDAVRAFGGEAVMTKLTHRSGTDRMAEVARKIRASIYINVQGDEPLLQAREIDHLIARMGHASMATLCHRIESEKELYRPDIVKVVMNRAGEALYFSRSPLPFLRHRPRGLVLWRHVGVYAFRAQALQQFVRWKPGVLEQAESLEQLRALENGMKIQVVPTQLRCMGVDSPEDVKRVARWLCDC